jgi:hypothetical protein
MPGQQLRVFTEKIAKHPDEWDLVKGLSQRKAGVKEMI